MLHEIPLLATVLGMVVLALIAGFQLSGFAISAASRQRIRTRPFWGPAKRMLPETIPELPAKAALAGLPDTALAQPSELHAAEDKARRERESHYC